MLKKIILLALMSSFAFSNFCFPAEKLPKMFPELNESSLFAFLFPRPIEFSAKAKSTDQSTFTVPFKLKEKALEARISLSKADPSGQKSEIDEQGLALGINEANFLFTLNDLAEPKPSPFLPEFSTCELGEAENGEYVIVAYEKLDGDFSISACGANTKTSRENCAITRLAALKPAERLKVYLKAVRSLEQIHVLGKVHNDVKPENIQEKDGFKLVKLVNFRFMAEEEMLELAKGSRIFSDAEKFRAASGEQVHPDANKGKEIVSFKADIYALAVALHEIECWVLGVEAYNLVQEKDEWPLVIEKVREAILSDKSCFAFKNGLGEIRAKNKGEEKEGIANLVEKMLAFEREARKITAEEVGDFILRLIQAEESGYKEEEKVFYKQEKLCETGLNQLPLI